MFADVGRMLMLIGGGILLLGALLLIVGRIPGAGRLPGDIVIQRDNFTCFAPLGTMIILSILLTLILNLAIRWLR
jgi:hypothetical protein